MKQETPEEAARDYIKGDDLSTFSQRSFFIAGAKWQEERVDELLNTLLNNNMCSVTGDELIEQFKNKGGDK